MPVETTHRHDEMRAPRYEAMPALAQEPPGSSEGPTGDSHRPEKVLVLCQLFYPELVSTGQTLTELAEQLVSQGVDVEVVCGPPTILGRRGKPPKRMVHRGIRIRRVWGTRFPKLSVAGSIANQVSFTCSTFLYLLARRPKKPILVLTNPPFLALACALLRRLRLGPPYLYLVFDVYPDTAVQLRLLRKGAWLARLWDRLNLAAFRQASAVIVIGRCMKDVIARKLRHEGPAIGKKVHCIPVWCDDEAIGAARPRRNGFLQRFGVQGKFVVGYFGNMGRSHDIETIMKAAQRLRNEHDMVFLFVGEGRKKRWAIEYARDRNLDNCRFHGYVAREELGQLLSVADLGLVSLLEGQEGLSVPSKTFGLMAAGVPVLAVVPAVSEIARMVEEQECGVWVRPGDDAGLARTILALKQGRREARSLGLNGKRAIRRQYNLRTTARQYTDLIHAIARPSVPGGSAGTHHRIPGRRAGH